MAVKPADIKALREKTGAGMMDCKNALTESNGDIKKAEKILKELGKAVAAKRSGKATNEGRVFSHIDGKKAGLVEIVCETDFVARNQGFIAMGEKVIKKAVDEQINEITDDLKAIVDEQMGKIKENMSIRRLALMDAASDELIMDYIHGEGKIGILAKVKVSDPSKVDDPIVKEFAFDCALHAAAFNPQYLSVDKVDAEYLSEQEGIFMKQVESMDKPDKVKQGIVKGKLKKHLSEICFVDQAFVKNDKVSVTVAAKDVSKELGAEITLVDYMYYLVGEELE